MRFLPSSFTFVLLFELFFVLSALQGGQTDISSKAIPKQGMASHLNVHFERLTIDNGLSQSSIFAMMQDKYGYLWFCTQDGLNRFDGYSFTIFRNRPEDSLSLAVNWVNNVYQAPSGRIWAMTRSSVNLYLPVSEQFRPFSCVLPKRSGQTMAQTVIIASVLEDGEGNLWIATDKGVFVIQNISSPMQATMSFVEEFAEQRIFALALDSSKTLIVGTSRGLFYKTKNTPTFRKYELPDALSRNNSASPSIRALAVSRNEIGNGNGASLWVASETELLHIPSLGSSRNTPLQRISLQTSLQKKSLPTSLHLDSYGTVWISLSEGLCAFLPKTSRVHAFTTTSGLAGNTVFSFSEDSTRRVWIGTNGGITIFEHFGTAQQTSKQEPFPYYISSCFYHANDPQSLSNAIVRSLLCDRTGTLWAGTDNGINSWNQLRYKFHTFGSSNNAAATLSNTSIRTFLSSSWLQHRRQNKSIRGFHPDSTLWVGTDDGLNLYDRRTNTWRRFGKDDGLSNTDIRALAWSEAGELLIGTNGGGLFRYNGKRFLQEIYDAETPGTLNSNRLRALYTDRSGTLWAGLYAAQGIVTQGTTGGLAYLPKGETKWRVLTSDGTEKTPSENEIRYLYSDSTDGANLWIGTHGGGLNYFDASTRTFKHFKHIERDSTSISSNIVSCILRSKAGMLWVATASGLNEFNPATQVFTRYTIRNGLPNDFIYGILEDNDGNLWLSTNKGISCFTPRTKSFRNYDRRDGLPSNEFNSGAFCKLPAGEMLFGSMNGFVIFPPNNIRDSKHTPPVVLSAINVMNTSRLFETSLAELESIRLPYNENFLAFEFAVLDFITPERNKYAYKLDGVDKDWLIVRSDRRYAAYNDLNAGEYTFRVKATNADGVWNEQERRLRVVIVPPFWQTWWFRGIMLLVAILCLWAAYRARVSYIQYQNTVLERLVHDRTAELKVANHELNAVNDEMLRQNHILEEQTAQIEIANTQLQEKYIELGILNEQLEDYTEEMERYSAKLEEQAKVIEVKNSQLQSKNEELAIVNEQLEDYTEEMERYSAKLEEQAREITAASTHIQEQNAALQDLNQRKNELIGVVAHDLKNPLAAILMTSSLVFRFYEKMTKDDHLQNMQRIKETGERMNKIITDLLDIEAIESGKFKLTLEECDVSAIVQATVEDYHDAAARKQISILTESSPNLALGYADKYALRQILDNLVSNAVKYSPPERRIWLTTRECPSMLMVDVRDEGLGLSDEDQTKLFGRFAKLTPQPTGGEHSTGLGLSIVKQLAEAMGGTVRCQSALGVGTTFTVEIPKKKG